MTSPSEADVQGGAPRTGRRWLIACGSLGLLLAVVTILVAAGAVTGWLLYPCLAWFALAILGALLYGLGGLLAATTPPAPAAAMPPGLERIAPGVLGYTVEADGALYIPVIMAEREGMGDVGRFLDGLPRDRPVKVPAVASERLRGMLVRRGFKPTSELDEETGERVEVFVLSPP